MRERNGFFDGGIEGNGYFQFPDPVAFAFNPLIVYAEISTPHPFLSLTLKVIGNDGLVVHSHEIGVSLFDGKAKIDYSRLVQLLFTNVKVSRSVDITVMLIANKSDELLEFSQTVLWGVLQIGDRLSNYGAYRLNEDKPYLEQRRIWFKKFPFILSFYSNDITKVTSRYDGQTYDNSRSLLCPKFDFIYKNLADIEYDSLIGYPTGRILYVIFVTNENRFYCLDANNFLCLTWTEDNGYADSLKYNDENGRVRDDLVVGCPTDSRFYKYNQSVNRLLIVENGKYATRGLLEIIPSEIFPNAKREVTIRQDAPVLADDYSPFDDTFDYTFQRASKTTTITHLEVCDCEKGYYLRWVDRLGFYQFYLFKEGEITIKSKESKDESPYHVTYSGIDFAEARRPVSISVSKTVKCCAVNLSQDVYDYVSGILNSPIVDLYEGLSAFKEEIWVPITIHQDKSEIKPNERYRDLEIELVFNDIGSQRM